MDKDFLRKLIQEVKVQGFAKRELGEILNAFGCKRRGVNNNETIKEAVREHGLNVVSFGDTSSTKLDFPVTIIGPRYINYKGAAHRDVGFYLEAYHPSVSPIYGDDICSDVLVRFNGVLMDHLPAIDRKTEDALGYVSESRLLKKKNLNSSVKSSIVPSGFIRPDYSVYDLTEYINVNRFAIVRHHSENRFFMLSALEWLQVLYKLR